MELPGIRRPAARTAAFTLPEVMVSLVILVMVFGAIITAYIQSAFRAEWSGLSLAAQAAGIQQLEATKSMVWDPLQTPVHDEIYTNYCVLNNLFPPVLLNLPVTGTNNLTYATNYATVTLIHYGANNAYSNYLVIVNTVWPFSWKGRTVCFTNTIADYFAPE